MEKMNLEPKTWTMAGEVSTYEFWVGDAMLVEKQIASWLMILKIGYCCKKAEE